MKSSYNPCDVEILLTDITGKVEPQDALERERIIANGGHYSQMLPIEYEPSQKYLDSYYKGLSAYSKLVARAVGILCDKIVQKWDGEIVLVSLARAGIPVGILVKRYLKYKYGKDASHYSISIIRDVGIDDNAMKHILARHKPESLVFVDGWTGKGAILRQLDEALVNYPQITPNLAVLSDPAGLTELCGTHEDLLIPSACLNCTVSGLISRTFYRTDIIHEDMFHGAVYYGEMADKDLSNDFISAIEEHFTLENQAFDEKPIIKTGYEESLEIAKHFKIDNINLVKPSVGETTRVLLRRVPELVLIREGYENDKALEHILTLAKEKNVPVKSYPLTRYNACGLIKNMADV